MDDKFYLTAADVRYQRDINKRVNGGRTSQRPAARRRRGPRGGSGRINIIHGNAVSAVTAGMTSFDINNITVRNGRDPREDKEDPLEQVNISSEFGFEVAAGGRVRAEQGDDGVWDVVQAQCPPA